MVLESVIRPWRMEKKPTEMFLIGLLYSSIGLLLALLIFGKYASLAGVFITTIPLIVVMTKVIRFEEKKDLMIHRERFLIKEHGKALSMFLFLFIGMLVSYSFWFTILPEDSSNTLFEFQIEIIESINPAALGKVTQEVNELEMILLNNFGVLIFCIIFSFLYGAGAIFILTLNASVIGVAIGSAVRRSLAALASQTHIDSIYNYFDCSVSITFCYMIHGFFEISAYFIGALAGGIISVAVVNHDFRAKEFRHIVMDSLDLLILSIVILILAGIIEVFITPMIC